jgi:hypothetical protein
MNELRREDKFLVPEEDISSLKMRLRRVLDIHSEESYFVESEYFDDEKNTSYWDKTEGVYRKNKYRKRFYNKSNKGHFEIKEKHGRINRKECLYKEVNDSSSTLCIHNLILQPILWINYQREAFEAVVDNKRLRVTFDSNITTGFSRGSRVPVLLGSSVVEFKYFDIDVKMSLIYDKAIDQKVVSLSKYAQGFRCLGL